MRFLFPGFLFALIAVLIPVIIHLFNFRKFTKVYFSNLSFLKQIEQQSSSPRRIKRRLLLAARILTLAFLVFAFAQPYIPARKEAGSKTSRQIISIYIDNSYSMEVLNKEGNLLDEAKRRAKEIASVYNLNDRYQLLTNDFEGRHQYLLSYEDFLSALDDVKISGVRRSLQQVIDRQQDLLSGNPGPEKTICLISDFQKNTLPPGALKVDTGISCRLISLKAEPQPNISVDSVWFTSPVHKRGDTEHLVVRLKNNSDAMAENVPVKITVDNQQKALGSLSIAPRMVRQDTLSFSGLEEGWKRGVVTITDYPITFDDRFFFSFYVRNSMSLLVINMEEQNPYLRAVYGAEPFFNIKNYDSGNINYSEIFNYPLIVLNGTKGLQAGLAQQLKIYAGNGGSLMVFPSLGRGIDELQILTKILGTDIPEAEDNGISKVTSVNFQHPLFKGVFEKVPRHVDLPVAKKYIRYSRLNRVNRNMLMELPGGRTFLSQYAIGKGHVYLSAVSLDEESGNLVRHSFFVPLMYQSAFLSLHDRPLSYIIGEDTYLEINKTILSPNQSLKLKNPQTEIIPDLRQTESGTMLFIADQIREQGHYSLVKGDSLLAVIAFNDNRKESDLSYASEKELLKHFPENRTELFDPGKGPLKNTIKAINYGVQLWKLCLILALIFLAAEILLLKFYGRREGRGKLKIIK